MGDFVDIQKQNTVEHLNQELERLLQSAPPSKAERDRKEFDGFSRLFKRFVFESGAAIQWDKIQSLPENAVLDYASLKAPEDKQAIANMLSRLVVVKLNGGLGTSMGCTGPKSLIQVRNDLTFLDMTIHQIESLNLTYGVDVPLILMNSFNTHDDTQQVLHRYKHRRVRIFTFLQSRYPRIDRETLMPIAKNLSGSSNEVWYPPGHGDFYEAFYNCGYLDRFIEEGKEYCFLSNIDNLGATVDISILELLLNPQQATEGLVDARNLDFVMEVTDKTRADVKGGTLILYEDKLRLLEIAQVPKSHVDEFKSISKFKVFNTNNLWVNLKAIKRLVEAHSMQLEIIVNHKHIDTGANVIQLETACGDAVKNFDRARGINVPRRRFLPVKKTDDLLMIMSNLYSIQQGTLIMNPKRVFPSVPLVKLGDKDFGKVRDFLNRFSTIPDLLDLDHLTVSGDVTFGKGVILKGTVIIIANHGERIDIPSGALLENKIVSGNLRIMDH
ncbi:UTP--glucose-1-phosphate uridylyltransferase-like [Paramacrobiotus metropolitanus]|uniref:UTP--glucose-1-phosphate uridylyltransferase-like n=1 Tax=Paramacrobiotus metropolitanus TaxID=2943436 RepID=UPI00244619F2|nr:UTP--glucose-1-phosphate uridylyltransferase-like [Paramacrobiotus metropolitanus]